MSDSQKTIFVAGGTGFVGRYIVRRLCESGHRVRVLVRPDSTRRSVLDGLDVDIISGDLLDAPALAEGVEGADVAINLVGIIYEQASERSTFEKIHEEGACLFVDAAWHADVKRFIYMSALGVRADARSRYHKTKWQAESYLRRSGLEYVVFRPSVIFGREDDFANRFAAMIAKLPLPVVPIIGQGWDRLHPIAVEDVAECFVKAANNDIKEGCYNLGGAKEYTMVDFIETIKKVMKRRRQRVHVPVSLVRIAATLMNLFMKHPPITPDQLIMMGEVNVAEPNDAEVFLPQVRSFEDGIRQYLGDPYDE